MRLELASTPAHGHSRPAVARQRLAHSNTAFNGPFLLLWNIKHHPFKAMGVSQGDDMDAAFPIEKIVQFGDMGLHLRKFHARIRIENAVNGHFLFHHQQKERRTVFSSAQADSVIKVFISACFRQIYLLKRKISPGRSEVLPGLKVLWDYPRAVHCSVEPFMLKLCPLDASTISQ